MSVAADLKWHPLGLFDQRFQANLCALRTRDAALARRLGSLRPASPLFIAVEGETVALGRMTSAGIEVLPNPIAPAAAGNMAAGLFPSGAVTWPVVIGGLGYGWLWDRIAKLPCHVETAPGHRPPVYFLAGDIERLWAVLHVLDWQELLAEPRFAIFAGADAADQLRDWLIANPTWPRPKACLRVEQHLWRQDFNALLDNVAEATAQRLNEIRAQLDAIYLSRPPESWSQKFRSEGLRVLGITSRYTSFLQHSMRDWLAGFETLGHETRLLIEPADHTMLGAIGFAQGIRDFKPDLILIIDHYRAEMGKLPASIPCAMYVQDRLPNIFSADAGRNQSGRDYCLGFGRLHLSTKYGYPAGRFLSCPVGINPRRFEQGALSAVDVARFGCEVSYVSHASTPADQLLQQHLATNPSPQIGRLFDDMYQRMEAWYAGGGIAVSEIALRHMLQESMQATQVQLEEPGITDAVIFFNQSIGNAMFRHQTLLWLADMGVDLHLWGNGWENHKVLKRFARGIASNASELGKIYRASRINIQVTPHGAVHQRLLDGLTAGGFFLLRWHPGDAVGTVYRDLLAWCQRHGIQSDAELRTRADDHVRQMIARIDELETSTPQTRQMSVFDVMNAHADMNFMNTAAAIWPEYDQVAFNTRQELESKVSRFLSDEPARRSVAALMRQAIVEECSYTSINQRLLKMISDDLSVGSEKCAA